MSLVMRLLFRSAYLFLSSSRHRVADGGVYNRLERFTTAYKQVLWVLP